MTEWQDVKLRDVCEIKGGKRLPNGVSLITVKNNHPYIRVRDLGKNRILQLNNEYEYVDDETQKTISHYIVSKNDVLISIVGTIGLIGIVGDSLDGANLTENCVKLISLKNIDRNYLYYFLMSKEGQNEIQQGTVGAVQAKLPIKNIQSITISLPPLDVQRKIAGILGALDDKIEVLREQNKTLEQMAQAVFQSWFVDFDIVRAKAAGLPAADVCKKYHITPDIYDLFPSAFSADNLPLGWEKKKLGDVCRYSKKKTDQTSIETYISTDNMNSNYGGIETASSVPDNGQSTCYKKGNILISNIRPYFKKIWYADKSGSCSNDVLVFIPKDFGNNMLYLLLARDSFFDFVMTGANGAKMPRGDKKHIMTYPVVVPNKDITVIFETLVTPFFEKIFTNQYEIACLIKLRDILLQKLISNDVDVGNVSLVS